MPVVTAALVARGGKKRDAAGARTKIQHQREGDARAAEAAFDALDTNQSGALTRSQTRELLARVTGIPAREVSEDGLEMVLADVRKKIARKPNLAQARLERCFDSLSGRLDWRGAQGSHGRERTSLGMSVSPAFHRRT